MWCACILLVGTSIHYTKTVNEQFLSRQHPDWFVTAIQVLFYSKPCTFYNYNLKCIKIYHSQYGMFCKCRCNKSSKWQIQICFIQYIFIELFINRKSVPDAINYNVQTAGHQATDWRILIRSTGNNIGIICCWLYLREHFLVWFFIDMWFQTIHFIKCLPNTI